MDLLEHLCESMCENKKKYFPSSVKQGVNF